MEVLKVTNLILEKKVNKPEVRCEDAEQYSRRNYIKFLPMYLKRWRLPSFFAIFTESSMIDACQCFPQGICSELCILVCSGQEYNMLQYGEMGGLTILH